jgi:hypothetical protein
MLLERPIHRSEIRLDLPLRAQRESRFGGSPSLSHRHPEFAWRLEDAESRGRAAPACDFCRTPLPRGERHRLVWESAALDSELILSDLCSRCATAYGSGSPSARPTAVRLVQEVRPSAAAPKVVGFIGRGAFYLLIAFAFFFIVTLISSYAR